MEGAEEGAAGGGYGGELAQGASTADRKIANNGGNDTQRRQRVLARRKTMRLLISSKGAGRDNLLFRCCRVGGMGRKGIIFVIEKTPVGQ